MALKTVYMICWTEYEAGWGQRPDGYTYCKNRKVADKAAEDGTSGTYELYWRASTPRLVEVDKVTYKEVQKKGLVNSTHQKHKTC